MQYCRRQSWGWSSENWLCKQRARELCSPRFLSICSKPEADVCVLASVYKSRDAIWLMRSDCFGRSGSALVCIIFNLILISGL